jgi:hypothetical protein
LHRRAEEVDVSKPKDKEDGKGETLPVTAEVGSEGGSYADPVAQKATLGKDQGVIDPRNTTPPSSGEVAEGASPVPQGPEDGVHFPERAGAKPRPDCQRP